MAHANRGQCEGEGKTNRTSGLDTRYLSGTLDGGDEFRWSVAALGDHDADGNVGVSDLLVLLANWGPCP